MKRRTFLTTTAAGAAALGFPLPLRAQSKTFKIGAIHPVTGALAEPGQACRLGQQKVQYVYRNFPTGSSFGRRAVQYFIDIFKEAGVSPKRVVLMYCNDLFGQNQARGFQAAHKAANPSWDIVEVIPWPEPPTDLSTEVSKAKAAKPDIIAPITRPASALLLFPEIRKQRVEMMGIVGPSSPGIYEAGQLAQLKEAPLQKFVFPRPRA